jgi:hypothetical protein
MKIFKIRILSIGILLSLTGGISAFGQPANPVKLTTFTPGEYSLKNLGLEDYPYKEMVTDLLQVPVPSQWRSSGKRRIK